MLNAHVVRYGSACLVAVACTAAFAQPTPSTVVVPPPQVIIDPVRPAVPERPVKPEATSHLAVAVVITQGSVKITSVKPGDGPPRGYLSDRPDLLVLIKSEDGEILSRTNIPDPLQLRVWNTTTPARVPRGTVATAAVHESTTTVPSARLTIYLPVLAGARTIEFRSGGEKGRLLGKGELPR